MKSKCVLKPLNMSNLWYPQNGLNRLKNLLKNLSVPITHYVIFCENYHLKSADWLWLSAKKYLDKNDVVYSIVKPLCRLLVLFFLEIVRL